MIRDELLFGVGRRRVPRAAVAGILGAALLLAAVSASRGTGEAALAGAAAGLAAGAAVALGVTAVARWSRPRTKGERRA